jgi:hypothetical protein
MFFTRILLLERIIITVQVTISYLRLNVVRDLPRIELFWGKRQIFFSGMKLVDQMLSFFEVEGENCSHMKG